MEISTTNEPQCDIIDVPTEITMKKKKKKRNLPSLDTSRLEIIPGKMVDTPEENAATKCLLNEGNAATKCMTIGDHVSPSSKVKVKFLVERSHKKSAGKIKTLSTKGGKKTKRNESKSNDSSTMTYVTDVGAAGITTACTENNNTMAKKKGAAEETNKNIPKQNFVKVNSAIKFKACMPCLNAIQSPMACTAGAPAETTVAADRNAGITAANTVPADCSTAGTVSVSTYFPAGDSVGVPSLNENMTTLTDPSHPNACPADGVDRVTVREAWNAGKTASATVTASCTAGKIASASCTIKGNVGDLRKSNYSMGDGNTPPTLAGEVTQEGPQIQNSNNGGKGGNEKLNFAGLFKENRLQGNGFKLSFHEFTSDEAMLDESDEVPLVENWGYCLIGCFTGPFPGRQALENIVKGWGVQCRYFPYAKGWTVFRFMNDADRIKILYGGPYVAYGKTLMLKIIDEGTMLSDDLFMKIPTWVLLHEVPLIVWSESGLSKLSSKVGTPLYTDKVTKDRSKMNYARCLIEVDVSKSPILEFPVIMSKGRRYVQKVSYEHFPDYCCDCRKFGHNVFNCPKKASTKVVLEVPPKPIHGSKNATVLPTIGKNIAKEPKKINVKVTTPTDKSTRGKAPIHAPTTNLAVAAPIEKGETSGTCHSEAIHGGSSNVTNCDGTMVESTVSVVPEDARSSHATVGATQLIAMDDIPLSHWVKVGDTPKKKGRGRASSSFVSKR